MLVEAGPLLQYDSCAYKKGTFGHTEGEQPVKMKPEIRVMQQKLRNPKVTSNSSTPPSTGREAWHGFSPMALEGTSPADTLALDFQPPQL